MYATPLKGHYAVLEGEKRVVPASPNVATGNKRRAALPHQNGPRGYRLAGIPFYAAKLRIAVAAVTA